MRKLACLMLLLLTSFSIFAQTREVKGTVVDEDGYPLPGVTVMATTKLATVTDADGLFVIRVPEGVNELSFSFVGMITETLPLDKTANVVLKEDNLRLDEVMVTAYGTSKKSSYTGSATVVKSEQLEKVQTVTVSQALQGLASGVQVINNSGTPGADGDIRIRGIGSMNASSSPLYVVDGVAYDGYLSNLNPSDIESMTVLKDAAATSLYGSRAGNGVILITTKKGQTENGTVNLKATYGVSALAVDLPTQMSPKDFLELNWEALYNGRRDGKGSKPDEWATKNLITYLGMNPYSVDNPVGTDGKLVPDAELLFYGDWYDELLATRIRQDYTVDFSGKSKNSQYFISFGYINDLGVFKTQKYERFSGRVNVSSQVKPYLEMGLNAYLSHSIQYAPDPSVWFLRSIPTIYPVYLYDYETGEYAVDDQGNKIYDYGDTRAEWIGWNPLADVAYNDNSTLYDNVTARAFAELTFSPYLKFRSNFSVDYVSTFYGSYTNPTYGYAEGIGYVSKSYGRTFSWTSSNYLTWDRTFGLSHFNALLGHEWYQYRYNSLSATRKDLPFDGLKELASAATMTDSYSNEDNYRLLSVFGKMEYDYAERYYLSASLRTDASSRFSPSSRWGTFWSVGGSWRLSQEDFMEETSDWLDNLKVKASYGAVGNDNITFYAYQGLYATGMNDYSKPGIMISRLPNEGLKWETNLQLNVGLDARLLNRFDLGIELFKRKSKDLLFSQPKAPSTGFGSIDRNIGTVQNVGFEVQLAALVMESGPFVWTVDFNASHFRNKIVKLPQEKMNAGYFKWQEGVSRYNFWGPEWAGVNDETGNGEWYKNVFDTDGTTVIERTTTDSYSAVSGDEQKKYLGDALPILYGGLTNSFKIFDFDFSFMVYYSLGGKLYDGDYSGMMGHRWGFAYHQDMLNRWTPENPTSDIPRLSTAYMSYLNSYSSRFIYDNTFVRLRNVTLGYNLPKSTARRVGITSARVFLQGDNLLTFGNAAARGTDPEQSFSGTTDSRFPTTKKVSFGIQVSL